MQIRLFKTSGSGSEEILLVLKLTNIRKFFYKEKKFNLPKGSMTIMCEFFHVKSVKTFLAFESKNAALYPDQSLKVRNRLDPDPQLLQSLSF